MKTRLLLIGLICLGLSGAAFSQEQTRTNDDIQTLFGNGDRKISHGGYAAFTTGYTQIGGLDAWTIGGRAGWVIDHTVTLGLAGKALINTIYLDGYWPDEDGYYLVGGYGGFFIEPTIAPKFPIHVSFPLIIGGGGIALNDYTWHDYEWEYDDYYPYEWDSYFVLEPGVELELNLVKFLRVGFGASYRYTTDMHIQELPKDMMRGWNYNFTLKMGVF
jgi:hypothetical protein